MAWCFEGEWHGQRQDIGLPMMICDLINAVNERYRIKRFFETGEIQPDLVFGESIGQSWTRPSYEDFNGLRLDLLMGAVERPLIDAIFSLVVDTSFFSWVPEDAWNDENGGLVIDPMWFPRRYNMGGSGAGAYYTSVLLDAGWPDGAPGIDHPNVHGVHRRDAVDRLGYCKDVLSLLQYGCLQWEGSGFWVDKNGRPLFKSVLALGNYTSADIAWPETQTITSPYYQAFPNGPNYVYLNPEREFVGLSSTWPLYFMVLGAAAMHLLWQGSFHSGYYIADHARLHLKPEFSALLFDITSGAEKVASWSTWKIFSALSGDNWVGFSTRHGTIASWQDEYGSAEMAIPRALRDPGPDIYPSSPVDVFNYEWTGPGWPGARPPGTSPLVIENIHRA